MKYLKKKTKSNCPVCGNEGGEILWQISSKNAAQHYILKEKNKEKYNELVKHIEYLWGGGSARVISCSNCRFCFSNPFVAGDEKFYTLAYDRQGYPKWKWEFDITLDFIKTLPNNFKLLEIGAGNGMFVKSLVSEYTSSKNIHCTEYSVYGLKELNKLGVSTYNIDVRNLNTEEQFDIICLFQVLEHLDDIQSLFKKIDQLLLPGGQLFIAVPNYNFIEFIEKNDLLFDMPPNHVGRWTKKSFEIIAEKYNWNLVNHKNEPSNWFANAKLIAVYHFLKKSQTKGTFANSIASKKYSSFKEKYLKIGCILIYSLSIINVFFKLKTQNIGNSQWVHLSKK